MLLFLKQFVFADKWKSLNIEWVFCFNVFQLLDFYLASNVLPGCLLYFLVRWLFSCRMELWNCEGKPMAGPSYILLVFTLQWRNTGIVCTEILGRLGSPSRNIIIHTTLCQLTWQKHKIKRNEKLNFDVCIPYIKTFVFNQKLFIDLKLWK